MLVIISIAAIEVIASILFPSDLLYIIITFPCLIFITILFIICNVFTKIISHYIEKITPATNNVTTLAIIGSLIILVLVGTVIGFELIGYVNHSANNTNYISGTWHSPDNKLILTFNKDYTFYALYESDSINGHWISKNGTTVELMAQENTNTIFNKSIIFEYDNIHKSIFSINDTNIFLISSQ
jgi:hypothetical protein